MKKLQYLLLIGLLYACQNQSTPSEQNVDEENIEYQPHWKDISATLVERMSLEDGERVLLVASPGMFDELILILADDIQSQGGKYLGTLSVTDTQPEKWSTDFIKKASKADSLQLVEQLKTVNLGVMMPGPVPSDLPYGILQDILEEDTRRTIHFHWSGAYDLNGNLLDVDDRINQFYEEAIIGTDYEKLAADQHAFEEAMRLNEVLVTTPNGTELTFQIGDRPVTKQDGNAAASRAQQGRNLIDREIEIPSGAIRVAPVEETVNGKIAFPNALWNNVQVKDLVMTIEKGKIIDVVAAQGVDAVKSELAAAEGNSGEYFREFALGFNPRLAIPEGDDRWIPYYGYGAGVVRLSLGDNSELGGNVSGGYVRWNFFVNATVIVGEEIWVDNGELIR